MKFPDIGRRSLAGLKQARLRTVLTSLAIGVGAFSLTMAMAIGQGGGEYAKRIITVNTEANSLWVMKQQDEKGTSGRPSEYTGSEYVRFNKVSVQPINQSDLDKIAAVSGVNGVQPYMRVDNAFVTRHGQKKYQAVVGVAKAGVRMDLEAGDAGLPDDGEAIIPDGYRQALGYESPEDAIGKVLEVSVINARDGLYKKTTQTHQFTIKAVLMASSMSLEFVPTQMLVSLNDAKKLNKYVNDGTPFQNKFIAGHATVDPKTDIKVVQKRIMDLGYMAQTPSDVYGALYQFVGVFQLVLLGFGILAAITAVVGILNTQYISVLERTQEIGLMKALGMSGNSVGLLFKIEAAIIGLIGSIAGVLLGVVVGLIINPLATYQLDLDKGVQLAVFTTGGTLGVVGFLTLAAMIASIAPSRRAATMDPIEALRSDKM